jgi:hypothetical protein
LQQPFAAYRQHPKVSVPIDDHATLVLHPPRDRYFTVPIPQHDVLPGDEFPVCIRNRLVHVRAPTNGRGGAKMRVRLPRGSPNLVVPLDGPGVTPI